jgi:hypothetical protein
MVNTEREYVTGFRFVVTNIFLYHLIISEIALSA